MEPEIPDTKDIEFTVRKVRPGYSSDKEYSTNRNQPIKYTSGSSPFNQLAQKTLELIDINKNEICETDQTLVIKSLTSGRSRKSVVDIAVLENELDPKNSKIQNHESYQMFMKREFLDLKMNPGFSSEDNFKSENFNCSSIKFIIPLKGRASEARRFFQTVWTVTRNSKIAVHITLVYFLDESDSDLEMLTLKTDFDNLTNNKKLSCGITGKISIIIKFICAAKGLEQFFG